MQSIRDLNAAFSTVETEYKIWAKDRTDLKISNLSEFLKSFVAEKENALYNADISKIDTSKAILINPVYDYAGLTQSIYSFFQQLKFFSEKEVDFQFPAWESFNAEILEKIHAARNEVRKWLDTVLIPIDLTENDLILGLDTSILLLVLFKKWHSNKKWILHTVEHSSIFDTVSSDMQKYFTVDEWQSVTAKLTVTE